MTLFPTENQQGFRVKLARVVWFSNKGLFSSEVSCREEAFITSAHVAGLLVTQLALWHKVATAVISSFLKQVNSPSGFKESQWQEETVLLFFFYVNFFKLEYSWFANVVLVSTVWQSESVIQISTLLRFFSHRGHYRVSSRAPYAIQWVLIVC